ncbi:hypothetical protein C7I55_13540 [Sphingomonas deserti]|uniref:Uncharacterized protein n=1 Tax=Allosphingosinicella deserti TaxID=2116704 RepID=A0A2P7QNU3_9SPHN|nr:hypothetical protein C7I55_13540 [Sphingomonas deserti]
MIYSILLSLVPVSSLITTSACVILILLRRYQEGALFSIVVLLVTVSVIWQAFISLMFYLS